MSRYQDLPMIITIWTIIWITGMICIYKGPLFLLKLIVIFM